MSTALRFGLLVAAPSAALLVAQKAVQVLSTYDSRGRPTQPPSREALAAKVARLQVEYDDLCAQQPASKARKLKAAALALADAKDDVFRRDLSAWLAA